MTNCTCPHPASYHDKSTGKCGVFRCTCPALEAMDQALPQRPRFLTPREVADRYACGLDWVYHCKALQPYKRKIGGKLRFLESDLLKFEDDRDGARYGVDKAWLMRRRHEYEQEHQPESILKFRIK